MNSKIFEGDIKKPKKNKHLNDVQQNTNMGLMELTEIYART